MYGATKAAVTNMTKTMAAELAPQHIRVNAYVPGVIDTPMNADRIAADITGSLIDAIALHRVGSPEEMAKVLIFWHRMQPVILPVLLLRLAVANTPYKILTSCGNNLDRVINKDRCPDMGRRSLSILIMRYDIYVPVVPAETDKEQQNPVLLLFHIMNCSINLFFYLCRQAAVCHRVYDRIFFIDMSLRAVYIGHGFCQDLEFI